MSNVLVTGMTSNRGGVESLVFNYVSRLSESIHFDFWCSNEHCAYESELLALGCGVYHGHAYGSDPTQARRDTQNFFATADGSYDVLWSNKSMLVNIDDLRLARKHAIPKIILHSHNSRDMFSGPIGVIKSILHRCHRQEANRLATDYWACSQDAAQYFFSEANIQGPNYLFIPNAIDVKKFSYNPQVRKEKRQELGIQDNTTVIGFVGRLEYQKNPQLLMRIFIEYHAANPDSILLVVGTGHLQDECETLILHAGISQSVIFLGARIDTAELYQAMDAFCLPSRFEGLPVVLVEAQSAGLPCIISDSISDEAQVTHLCTSVSESAGPKEWAEALIFLLQENTERGSSSDGLLHSQFDIDNVAYNIDVSLRKQHLQ